MTQCPVPNKNKPFRAINIILDSVGRNQFLEADTPNLDKIRWECNLPAQTSANATFPATSFFMQGRIPYVDGTMQVYGKCQNLPKELKEGKGAYTIFYSSLMPLIDLYCKDSFDEFILYDDDKLTEQGLVSSDKILMDAKDRIAELNQDNQNYFAYLHLGETHYRYDKKLPNGKLDRTRWDVPDYYLALRYPDHHGGITLPPDYVEYLKKRQREAITYLDKLIGEFLEGLEYDLLIVTSDHGQSWGEDGLWFHGRGMNDSIILVPLMILWK